MGYIGYFAEDKYVDTQSEPILLAAIFVFLVVSIFFLLNLLIAQLSCCYAEIFEDMVGCARLERMRIIVEYLPAVNLKRWLKFVGRMSFEQRIEFNEGDVGLANGIAVLEGAHEHPTTVDSIKRYGGPTSSSIQWPDDDLPDHDVQEKFDRLEALVKRSMERIKKGNNAASRSSSGAGSRGTSGDEDEDYEQHLIV